jgi:tellurite resistance protein
MTATDLEANALLATKTPTAPTPATGGTGSWRMLDYLPVGLFGSVMGLTGLSVAWRLAHTRYGVPAGIADAIGAIAMAVFVALTIGYLIKLATATDAAVSEFRHPIAGNLFGTVLISLLLLPIVLAPISLRAAQVMWVIGAVGMFAFAWIIVTRWMSDRQQIAHATPAWIVPVVGLLDVPLALPSLGLPPMHGVMMASLAVGLFFAVPLFTLIFSRLVFEPPIPDALQPTLLILVAPFAVGMSTYIGNDRRNGPVCGSAVHADAVPACGAAQSPALSVGVLPVPGFLVGGQLSARCQRDRSTPLRVGATLGDH